MLAVKGHTSATTWAIFNFPITASEDVMLKPAFICDSGGTLTLDQDNGGFDQKETNIQK